MATAQTAAPTLSAKGGFTSLTDEISVDSLPLSGTLPAWLQGSLIRTGPANWEIGKDRLRHWFDGEAMLHRFAIADGNVSYANQFLDTRTHRAGRELGAIPYREFATDPCRSLFKRVSTMFSPQVEFTDNCNVNLTRLGDRFIAMTETPIPVQFDPQTLKSAGVAYEPPGELTTAHPHMDRATKGMLNYAARLGPRNSYRFFHLRPEAREPELVATIPVREPAYMHSFGLTERWLILAEFPFVVNSLRLALSGRPYIENYRWKPERGTRFTLVDRHNGQTVGPMVAEPRFGFHHVNAYEDGDEIVADICTFPDHGIVEDLYMDRLRAGMRTASPSLERFRLNPGAGKVGIERLIDEPFDLPRINYKRCNERPYRYTWGVGWSDSDWINMIVKADVQERTADVWSEPGCYPGEPVFTAAPDAANEDEGVLLSVVFDAGRETSFLLVLDAATLEELSRAEVPHHIPFGFHGQYAAGV